MENFSKIKKTTSGGNMMTTTHEVEKGYSWEVRTTHFIVIKTDGGNKLYKKYSSDSVTGDGGGVVCSPPIIKEIY